MVAVRNGVVSKVVIINQVVTRRAGQHQAFQNEEDRNAGNIVDGMLQCEQNIQVMQIVNVSIVEQFPLLFRQITAAFLNYC